MKKSCPYCGQPAARTKDLACQWCANPLLSDSYETLPQTYQQLQQERRRFRPIPEESEESPPSPAPFKQPVSVKTQPLSSPRPELPPEPPVPLEAGLPLSPAQEEPLPEIPPETEPAASVADIQPEPAPEQEEAVLSSEPAAGEPLSQVEPEPEREPEVHLLSVAEIELKAVNTGIMARELTAAYEANKDAVDAGLRGKVIRITGLVGRTVVMDFLDIYYLVLNGSSELWNIRCTFSKQNAPQLRSLSVGQTVTVQGLHSGYEKNIQLKDCTIVS